VLGSRITLEGPMVSLKAKAAITIGLALHELARNAREHGALSVPSGKVQIDWSLASGAGGDKGYLKIRWRELDGPAVRAPKARGFGLDVIERQVFAEIGASAEVQFAVDGVEASLAVPLGGSLVVLADAPASLHQPAGMPS